MNRSENSIFGLATLDEYLGIAKQATEEFSTDKASTVRCFSALLILNHLVDWLTYKLTAEQKKTLNLEAESHAQLRDLVEAENGDLRLIRSLSNGFKHLSGIDRTGKISGWGEGPYDVGPFDIPFLLIDLGEDEPAATRWIVADELTTRVFAWWRDRLNRQPAA